jgi:predicted negative regulator of RcsB-dependent stress response
MTEDPTAPTIVITDAVGADSGSSWWETAKRWIKTPGALYLTVLLLVVSGTQAWVAWKQRQTMQGQLKAMTDALPINPKSADAAETGAGVARSSLVSA